LPGSKAYLPQQGSDWVLQYMHVTIETMELIVDIHLKNRVETEKVSGSALIGQFPQIHNAGQNPLYISSNATAVKSA